jgi:hypothetical protein
MNTHAKTDNSEIVVSGKDMFGASFTEKTRLLNLDTGEFSFSLFRPVSENQSIRVNFHPDAKPSEHWIDGLIVNVKNRLDGMQTVEVQVIDGCENVASGLQQQQSLLP